MNVLGGGGTCNHNRFKKKKKYIRGLSLLFVSQLLQGDYIVTHLNGVAERVFTRLRKLRLGDYQSRRPAVHRQGNFKFTSSIKNPGPT